MQRLREQWIHGAGAAPVSLVGLMRVNKSDYQLGQGVKSKGYRRRTSFYARSPLQKKKIDIFLSFFEGRGFDWGQVTSCSLQLNWSVPTKVTTVKIVSVQNPVKSKKLKKLKKGEGDLPSCIDIRVACFQILSY